MSRKLFLLSLGVLLCGVTVAPAYDIGEAVHDFNLPSIDGDSIWLSGYHDKIVVIAFWSFGCIPCRREAPVLEEEFWQVYGGEDLQVLSIGVGATEEQGTWWREELGLTYPILLDRTHSIYAQYGDGHVPHNVILDRNHSLVYSEYGFRRITMLGIIDSLLSLPTPSPIAVIPERADLLSSYPNPFNPSTTIRYTVDRPGPTELIIYDLLGREVAELVNTSMAAGCRTVQWNATNAAGHALPSGFYLVRLTTAEQTAVQKIVLMR